MVIDWGEVPGILLDASLTNTIGLLIVFGLAAAISLGVARALGGKGAFGLHSLKISAAYLKIVLAVTGVALLTLLIRLAGLLNFVVVAWAAKSMSEAIAEVYGFSNRRGCLPLISLAIAPIVVIAAILLLGPLSGK